MAKAKKVDKDIEDIKRLIKEGKAVIGQKSVIRGLRAGSIGKVYLASNSSSILTEDVEHMSRMGSFSIKRLGCPNDELGVICKKPFSISVLGIIR